MTMRLRTRVYLEELQGAAKLGVLVVLRTDIHRVSRYIPNGTVILSNGLDPPRPMRQLTAPICLRTVIRSLWHSCSYKGQ